MGIELVEYAPAYEAAQVARMADFCHVDADKARRFLDGWLGNNNRLFVITENGRDCGFLRLQFGGGVAYIESLYVDEALRGKGIGSAAIGLAEEVVRDTPEYEATGITVSLENPGAMRLYHRLGFLNACLLDLQKPVDGVLRGREIELDGLSFRY